MNLDQTLLRSLINSYDEIVSLPEGYPALNARTLSAQQMKKTFEPLKVEIKGSENLPKEKELYSSITTLKTIPTLLQLMDFRLL